MGIYQQNKAMFLSYKEEFCFEWADFNEQVIWEPNWPHVGKLKFLLLYSVCEVQVLNRPPTPNNKLIAWSF